MRWPNLKVPKLPTLTDDQVRFLGTYAAIVVTLVWAYMLCVLVDMLCRAS